VLFGFVVGFVEESHCVLWTVALAVLMAVSGGIMHWTADQMGIDVDWGSASGAAAGAFLTFLVKLPLALAGAMIGRVASHSRVKKDRPTESDS
jgi:hypothetical protein